VRVKDLPQLQQSDLSWTGLGMQGGTTLETVKNWFYRLSICFSLSLDNLIQAATSQTHSLDIIQQL